MMPRDCQFWQLSQPMPLLLQQLRLHEGSIGSLLLLMPEEGVLEETQVGKHLHQAAAAMRARSAR